MADLANIMEWTFVSETTVPKEVQEILVPGEEAHAAYKTIRDVAVITNKRIIISDKQGITGKKVEVYTIPFKSIVMYSSENAGLLMSTRAGTVDTGGQVQTQSQTGVDIRKLDRLTVRLFCNESETAKTPYLMDTASLLFSSRMTLPYPSMLLSAPGIVSPQFVVDILVLIGPHSHSSLSMARRRRCSSLRLCELFQNCSDVIIFRMRFTCPAPPGTVSNSTIVRVPSGRT